MAKPDKSYATIKDPTIAAVVSGLYSFTSESDGVQVLKQIKDKNIASKAYPETDSETVFWIREYDITPEDEKQGCKGNFCKFVVSKSGKGKFTLKAEKIAVEPAKHPERKYQKFQHPNWGHPVLRSVKKKKQYKQIEQAENDLRFLQEEFPLIAIPGPGKLYIMVFEKENNKGSVKKYVLEIKIVPEGGFYIDHQENLSAKKEARPATKEAAEAPKAEAVGDFTSQVLLKRAQKRGKAKPKRSVQDILTTNKP